LGDDKTSTLFLSHSPAAVKEVSDQILQSMLVAEKANAEALTDVAARRFAFCPAPDAIG